MNQTDITKESLIQNGWVEVVDGIGVYMEKLIENRNPINSDPEDTDIKLVLHGFFNSPKFAILLPDGGMINFVANRLADLNKFESQIDFYDCPY